MKTATITSLLLAAGSSLAAPAKRSGEAITITNFKATESNTAGTISFDIYDPNFSQNDSASVSWTIPGNPPADVWTASHDYTVQFPNGVRDITFLVFDLARADQSETIQIALNSNAELARYNCNLPVDGMRTCVYPDPIVLTPQSA